jgi:DNA-binding transcriptional MerR regulator
MTSPNDHFSIQQAAAQTGLTPHTLRYYERINLIPPIQRDENGYRYYSAQDIRHINFLCCLIHTQMPLDQVKRYAELYADGDERDDERAAILLAHREEVERQIAALNNTLIMIDYKLARSHPQKELEKEAT